MTLLIISMTIIILLTMTIMILVMMISKKVVMDTQKATPFECGFNPMSYTRLPFSMHFFLIAVIFLIFDIEIIMIMPAIITMKLAMMKFWLITSISFTLILLIGLYHEWSNSMIDWAK